MAPWPATYSYLPGATGTLLVKIWEAQPLVQGQGQPGEILQADKTGLVVACGQGALRVLSGKEPPRDYV